MKSAQRATSSFHVDPPAPTASVGGGAGTPTPNVKTPAGAWPSPPITRQRTVYAAPRRSPETGARTTLPRSVVRRCSGHDGSVGCEHLYRVPGDRDGLVELEPDLGRSASDARLRRGRGPVEDDVGMTRGRGDEHHETGNRQGGEASHRTTISPK